MTLQPGGGGAEIPGDMSEAVRLVGRISGAIRKSGRAAFAQRVVHPGAVQASIGYDSFLDDSAQLRSPAGPRIVIFEAGSLSIEVSVTAEQLAGQVIPPTSGDITMLTLDGVAAATTASEMGSFMLSAPPPGPIRFHCRIDEAEVFTDWMELRPAAGPIPPRTP